MPFAELPPLEVPPLHVLANASLFLDFDGTLVELAERPEAISVGARTGALVRRLAELLEGRVALISGRPVAQIRDFLDTDLTVVGSHGLEYGWRDGRPSQADRPVALDAVETAMHDWAGRWTGVLVESKPLGAALHYRQCPDAEEGCVALATQLASRHGLHLQPGKMMVEVRAGGGDKGTAIRALMREPDMAGTRPVFMGDDHTDEPGFLAAAELGGAGVLVGPMRETAARYRLQGVDATLAWLEAASAKAA